MTVVAEVVAKPDNSGFQYTRIGKRFANPDFVQFFGAPKDSCQDSYDIYNDLK